MTVLVAGGTGATGRLLVQQLLDRGQEVRAIVRSPERLLPESRAHGNLSVIQASLLDLSDGEMARYVAGCDAVASCLGHNLTMAGIFGHPRLLVTEATRRLCRAIHSTGPARPVRFVLMNTAGNSNRDIPEQVSAAQKAVVGLIRLLVPPQRDNENAADVLRVQIGQGDPAIEWCVVRPDSLINQSQVSDYQAHLSPIRSAIFNPGKTSRVNVAHFMAELMTDDALWQRWKGQMPVLYNSAPG